MSRARYIIVSGFFYSGSSAVIDLLREYKDIYEPGSEMRIITDPYGLIQLEKALIDDWNWIRSAMAIQDFIEYSRKCSRAKSHFPLAQFGMGYKRNLNPQFNKITEEYIDRLTEFKFCGDFYAFKAKEIYFKYVINRCRFAIEKIANGKIKCQAKRMLHYSHPTKDKFYEITKDYFDNIFNFRQNEIIVLDQAISPRDNAKINDYFRNGKMIIVDRDPRDIFIDSIINGKIIYGNSRQHGINFCNLQISQRENCSNTRDVKIIKFEDLILNYDRVVNDIQSFLGISKKEHINCFAFFDPNKSRENIGIWKRYFKQYNLSINVIEEKMKDYLFEQNIN